MIKLSRNITTVPLPADKDRGREVSQPSLWWGRDGNGLLLIGGLLFLALFVWFWPRSFSSMDESVYINMAAVLRHGTVYPDVAGIPVVTAYPLAGHLICKYPLGMPTLLALVSLFGWRFALVTNLVIHLLTYLLVIRLLRRMGSPAGFALLYLLYPTAVLYSRTLMADPLSGLLLALAFDQYLSRRVWAVGALIGLAVDVRTGNILALPVFLAALLLEGDEAQDSLQRRLARAATLLAGASPFLLPALYYARVIAGGKMAQNTGTFSSLYFPHMFPAYVLGLMLIYPGMLLAPALHRGRGRVVIGGLCYGFLMLYSFWYYRDQGSSWAETLIVGQRYFLAALPLWIVAYSAICGRVLQRLSPRTRPLLVAVTVMVLFYLAGGISARHEQYTAHLADVRTRMLSLASPDGTLICSVQIAKLFYPGTTVSHLFPAGDQLPREDLLSYKRASQSALARPGGHVFLAAWLRPGRGDYRAAAAVAQLARSLGARPLSTQARSGLSSEVAVYELCAAGSGGAAASANSVATATQAKGIHYVSSGE